MRKFTFLLLAALATLGFTASAQIQEGNVLIGTSLSDLNLQLNSPNKFSFDISPKAAWFIDDNIALGGYVNLGIETAKGSNSTFTYGVGALARYYTGSDVSVLRHGRFFGEATIGPGGTNTSGGGSNTNGLNFSVGPGFAYFVTPSIGLETMLKYGGYAGFGGRGYQSNLDLSFGFQIYLPGKSTIKKVKGDVK